MKKCKVIILLVIFLAGGLLIGRFSALGKVYDDDLSNQKQIKEENTLSMMIEQTEGAGDYKMETRSSWPTDGYKFNATLSKCENGGELSWDSTNNVVTMTGNMSDKCYVYFDIYVLKISDVCWAGKSNASECIIEYATKENVKYTNIYHHDGTLENGLNDDSYRYAGANPNNYVCIKGESPCSDANLFRIIGVIDGKVKLIKATSIGNQYWDTNGSNTWSTSTLNTYLNGDYLTSLGTLPITIADTTWKVGGNTYENITDGVPEEAYEYEITSLETDATVSSKIALMYAHDYGFAASQTAWDEPLYYYGDNKTINWLYLGSYEWLLSRVSDYSGGAFAVDSDGNIATAYNVLSNSFAVRPVFFLDTSGNIYQKGDGTIDNPIYFSFNYSGGGLSTGAAVGIGSA